MTQSMGTISESQGVITATNREGVTREVSAGDQIFDSDVISVQGRGSSVSINFNNGCQMSLGEGETALIDETLYKVEFYDNSDVAVALDTEEDILTEVLAEEEVSEDIYDVTSDEEIDLDELEDTAAGEEQSEEFPTSDIEIEENILIETGGTTSLPENETRTARETFEHGIRERGGELFIPTTPIFDSFGLNSLGFLNSSPTLSGSAPAGSVLEVFDNDDSIGTVTVDSSGNFSFVIELEDGEHSISAEVTTIEGQTSVRSEPIVFTLDTQAPDTIIIDSAGVIGSSTPTINGRAEALSTVTLNVGQEAYSVTADEAGLWSVELNNLDDGAYEIAVVVTDQAGNSSEPLNSTITIDTLAPDAPTIDTLGAVNSATPLISGNAEAGGTVAVYVGTNLVGEATVSDDGSWSLTLDTLTDGLYAVTAVVTDAAGNVSDSSSIESLTIDTQLPDEPVIETPDLVNTTNPTISGTANEGDTVTVTVDSAVYTTSADEQGSWSVTIEDLEDGDYSVSVYVTDSAGNDSSTVSYDLSVDLQAPDAPTVYDVGTINSSSVVLSGKAEAGSQVSVYEAGILLGQSVVQADGTWSLSLDSLAEDDHTFFVSTTDGAGNVSGAVTETFTVDMTAPDAPVVESVATEDGVTTIAGSSEANSHMTVTVGDTNYLTDANAQGEWSVTVENLADGSHTLSVVAEDAAGNSSEVTVGQTIVIDTEALEAPTILDVVDVNGDYSDVQLSGSGGGSGNTIQLYDEDGTMVATTVVASDGTWSLDISQLEGTPINDNEFFHAVSVDAAGNMSESSDIVHYWHGSWSSFPTDGYDDFVLSGSGNDTYHIRHDDENDFLLFDGGDGRDTIVLHGNSRDYSVAQTTANTVLIAHEATGDVIEVRNVENFGFLNGEFDKEALLEAGIYSLADSNNDVNLVAEDVENGMLVGITAAALDISGDDVSYSLVDEDGLVLEGGAFAIDANSGEVTVADKSQIDYEQASSHTITIKATSEDGSSVERSFNIGITDVDDTAPQEPTIMDIDVDRSGVLSLSGHAEEGSTVNISMAEGIYTTTADEAGLWSLQTQELGSGVFILSVTASDEAGNHSQPTYANVTTDTSRVNVELGHGATQTRSYDLEDTSLYGITTEKDFDPSASALDLSLADADTVVSHNKGYGIEGGYKGSGEKKAIGQDEAMVIKLGTEVDTAKISINQLHFYEAGVWTVYDADMQKVGEGDFGFFNKIFRGGEDYESGFFSNHGTLNIENSEADFQYIVLSTGDNFQGTFSSFFVEDVSYEVADSFHYDLTLENIPMSDNATALYIDGLGEGVYLEDASGDSVGSFDNGSWYLDADDISDLNTLIGTIELDVVSDEAIDIEALNPEVTLVEINYDSTAIAGFDTSPLLNDESSYFDFDDLDEVQRIDLSEGDFGNQTLDIKEVMDITGGDKYLEIVSGDDGRQELTLDANAWEVKIDMQGNVLSFNDDGTSYTVYVSTEESHDFELLIDENIAIILEN